MSLRVPYPAQAYPSVSVSELVRQQKHVPKKLEQAYVLLHDGYSLMHRSLFTISHLLHKVNDLFDLFHKARNIRRIGNRMKGNNVTYAVEWSSCDASVMGKGLNDMGPGDADPTETSLSTVELRCFNALLFLHTY